MVELGCFCSRNSYIWIRGSFFFPNASLGALRFAFGRPGALSFCTLGWRGGSSGASHRRRSVAGGPVGARGQGAAGQGEMS